MKRNMRILAMALGLLLAVSVFAPTAFADNKDCGAKLLAITFDDGPGAYTGQLLDGLASRGAKATFFISGYRAGSYSGVLQRMAKEGHQLANHTYNHKKLSTLSASEIKTEINSTKNLLVAAGGNQSYFIRPPYGSYNDTVKTNAGAPLILWSVDPLDWKYRNSTTVCDNIVKGSFDGAIILVHDIYQTSVAGAWAAIDKLKAQGYEFVTVKELMQRRGVTPQNGVTYSSIKNNGINLSKEQISPEYYDEDLLTSHWGYSDMKNCLENGWMKTDGTGRWLPNHYMSRADFVMALAKYNGVAASYGQGEPSPFADVSTADTVYPYIKWAADHGIANGTPTGFHGGDILNRQQMATLLLRFWEFRGIQAPAATAEGAGYADEAQIADWAKSGVAVCTKAGLLQGKPNNRFAPTEKLTRAQTAAVLVRLNGVLQTTEKDGAAE